MIENIQVTGVHTKLTDEEEMYIDKKIASLDKFIPKKARESTKVEIKIKHAKSKTKDRYNCEAIFRLPRSAITVNEKGETILASIDIVENKLKIQLKKYKDTHGVNRIHKQFIRRLKRKK